jgi:hypothetical protein
MTLTAAAIPGYVAGTWTIDPAHSEISFSVRHLAISKVKGTFENFDVTLVTADEIENSTVEASIEIASVNTGQEPRDQHLRTSDFFAADEFPQMTFRSTGIRTKGDDLLVDGDLTLRRNRNRWLRPDQGGRLGDDEDQSYGLRRQLERCARGRRPDARRRGHHQHGPAVHAPGLSHFSGTGPNHRGSGPFLRDDLVAITMVRLCLRTPP